MTAGTAPRKIRLHRRSATLELVYGDDERHELEAEFLRVHSPSAEVRGHGRRNGTLPTGKRGVGIRAVEPVGRYAIRIVFDDGHDSGIFSWDYLRELCRDRETLWQQYLDALQRTGGRRDPLPAGVQAITIEPPSSSDTDTGRS